jgi:hypothetical protein
MDRTGELADQFELTSLSSRKALLRDFKGDWLWMVFLRHLG